MHARHAREIDITQLKKSRLNIFSLAIRLLGLSADDKEKLNIEDFYDQLFHQKLEDTIHQDLVKCIGNRKINNKLKNKLAIELIRFVTSITTEETFEILNHFADIHAKKCNVDGAILFLRRVQNSENILLYNNRKLFDVQTFKIVIRAWKEFFESAKQKKSCTEKFLRTNTATYKIIFSIFVFVVVTLFFLFLWRSNGIEQALLFYLPAMCFNVALFDIAVGTRPPIVPQSVRLESENDVTNESKSLLDKKLNGTIEDYIQQYLDNIKLQKEKESKRESADPLPAKAPVTFPEEKTGAQRPKQNKKTTQETTTAETESKIPQKIIGRRGNVYHLLFFQHKKKAYYRYNRKETIQLLEDSKVDSQSVIVKVEGAVSNNRVNPPGEKYHWGVTLVNGELEKFPHGMKLRIEADARPSLKLRVATEEEQELGIEEVVSPKSVQFHARSG
jgi:hypothetical protein